LIDVTGAGVTGKIADERCGASGITLNKNSIPFDPNPPAVSSGIRVGTPSTTTQGMGVDEMAIIAKLITRAIKTDDAAEHAKIKSEVQDLVAKFPIYA
jgi:glycine hydroxymethyltransferase